MFATGRANNRMVHVAPYGDLRRPEVLPAFGQRLDGLAVARERAVAVVNQAQSDHNVWAVSLSRPGERATGLQKLVSTTWGMTRSPRFPTRPGMCCLFPINPVTSKSGRWVWTERRRGD